MGENMLTLDVQLWLSFFGTTLIHADTCTPEGHTCTERRYGVGTMLRQAVSPRQALGPPASPFAARRRSAAGTGKRGASANADLSFESARSA